MPPCAQTECERLTGTTEKSSTAWPASAIFIAAASPASPPPTIATRIWLFAMSVKYPSEQPALPDERELGVDADGQQEQPEGDAGVARQALRALADDDAPVDGEEPQAVGQVPHGRCDADEVDGEDDRFEELAAHDVESLVVVGGDRQLVQARDESEAEVQDVEGDEEEEDDARHALDGVEPVARVRVGEVVGPRLPGDEQPVDGVVDEGDEDADDLDEEDVGDGLEVFDRVVEVAGPGHRLRVGVEVLQQEDAERQDAGQLVELPQDERSAQTDCHVRYDAPSPKEDTHGRNLLKAALALRR